MLIDTLHCGCLILTNAMTLLRVLFECGFLSSANQTYMAYMIRQQRSATQDRSEMKCGVV